MKTIGYIVECARGGVMESGWDQHANKWLLYFGNHAGLFKSRRSAQRAIKRTVRERPTFEQEFGRLLITRVEAADEK